MKDITVEIQGITPLICNRFTEAAQAAASSATRGAINGDKGSAHEQAEQKLYTNDAGEPCIPQPNIFRCIIDGGTFFKAGKSKVTTIKSSLIPACMSVEGVMIPIRHSNPWTVDTRPVRIPSTGGRILTHRPMFEDWALEFVMCLDETFIGVKLMREIVDASGMRIGLGDFRPACKGPFGKFVVTQWSVQDAAMPMAAE